MAEKDEKPGQTAFVGENGSAINIAPDALGSAPKGIFWLAYIHLAAEVIGLAGLLYWLFMGKAHG